MGTPRENVNEALLSGYRALRDEKGWTANIVEGGSDRYGWAFQYEKAIQDRLTELHDNPPDPSTDKGKAQAQLQTDLNSILTTIEANRNAGIRSGDNVDEWKFDVPTTGRTTADPNIEAGFGPTDFSATNERTTQIINGDFEAASEIAASAETEAEGDLNQADVALTALQCFLVYNIEAFSEQHKDLLSNGAARSSARLRARPPLYKPASGGSLRSAGGLRTDGYYSYPKKTQRIFLVGEGTNGSSTMNRLLAIKGHDEFVNITSAEYANLIPQMRIFKIYRNKDNSGVDKSVEVKFDNRTRLTGITDQLTIKSPQGKSYQTFSRGVECGIKSFSWNFMGSDPYTATRDIEANLKLHFQHFSQLVAFREGQNEDDPNDTTPLKYRYIDLIVQPNCRDKQTPQRHMAAYSPECYEIKVEVGYADPGPNSGLSADLRDAISCQKQDLRLIMTDHSIDINQDGTFELSATYRGRLGSLMSDKLFNVLLPGGGFADIEFEDPDPAGTPRISRIQKDIEQPLVIEKSKPKDSRDEGKIKDLEFRRRRFFAQNRRKFHNKIISTLATSGFIHKYSIDRETYKAFSRWQTDSRAGQLPNPLDPTKLTSGIVKTIDALAEVPPISQEETSDPDTDPTQATAEAASEAQESLQARLQSRVQQKDIDIHYFFFGDLIAALTGDVLGDAIFTEYERLATRTGYRIRVVPPTQKLLNPQKTHKNLLENFKTIIGTADVNIQSNGAVDPAAKIYNLAHIPVSLESFSNFMIEQVVSQDKVYYSYFSFLDDLLSHMFTNVLGSECFGGLIESKLRPATGIIESPKVIRDSAFSFGTNKYKSIDLSKCTPDTPAFYPTCGFDNTQRSNSHTHFVIYSSNVKDDNLAGTLQPGVRGDPIGDRNRGIIHTAFGLDRGLLRNVQFQKTDQEFLPEARFAAEGDNIFNQIANVYDVTFGFSGTSLFRPGQLIYFNPSSVGAGNPYEYQLDAFGDIVDRSWANLMGLGGYHIITEVANVIESGKYETTVKARWVTGGKLPVIASVMSSPPLPSMGGN